MSCCGLASVQAQSNDNVGGLGEVSSDNPYPSSTLTFIGTAGHIRALDDVVLGSRVMTEDGSVARLSAVAGRTLSVPFADLGRDAILCFGSTSDTGTINVTSWNGVGGLRGQVTAAPGGVRRRAPADCRRQQWRQSVRRRSRAGREWQPDQDRHRRAHAFGRDGDAGATTVNGGTLVVNGSIANSSGVALNAGGTLGGSDTVPSVTVAGGTLSPGNSRGMLTIDGDLTLDAASAYRAELQGPLADRIVVTGTAAPVCPNSIHTTEIVSILSRARPRWRPRRGRAPPASRDRCSTAQNDNAGPP